MDRLGCVEVGRFVGVRLWKSRFWGMRGTCSYTQRTPLRALGPPSKASHKQCRWNLAVDDWNSRCKLCTREPDSGFCLIKQLDYISGLVASLFGTVMYCMTSSWPCLRHGLLTCSLPLPTALASNLLGAPPPNPWLIIGVNLIVELGWQRLSEADKNT